MTVAQSVVSRKLGSSRVAGNTPICNPFTALQFLRAGESFESIKPRLKARDGNTQQWQYAVGGAGIVATELHLKQELDKLYAWVEAIDAPPARRAQGCQPDA
jgi:hypothetical protein